MSGIKKEFIKTFNEIINNNKQKELRDIWRKGKMNFTNFISPLILKIAPLIKMESTYSYWSLDFIFYNDVFENINYNLKDGKWAKKINVIIEHENEIEKSCEEIIKLNLWKADLKVLITYPKNNARKYTKEYIFKLYESIFKEMNVVDENESFLILLGYDRELPIYDFYEWDNNKKFLNMLSFSKAN